MASFNATVDRYKAMLAKVDSNAVLLNENVDSGEPTVAGKYAGAGEAYAKLLGKLVERQFPGMKPDLRQNILAYYKDVSPLMSARSSGKERDALTKTLAQLGRLNSTPEAGEVWDAS